MTRYPDMNGLVASERQRERRDLFREAVVYARWIVADEERKKAFRKTLPLKKRKHVYRAAIQLYMRMQGDMSWLRKQLAVKEVIRSARGGGVLSLGHDQQPATCSVIWHQDIRVEVVRKYVIEDPLVSLRI